MSAISDRIALVVQQSGLKKTAFAEKINVSQPHVSRMVSGETAPSDRTIADICRVFGIREEWLRDGSGEMYRPKSKKEELAAIFSQLLESDDAKSRLTEAFVSLPDEAYPRLEEYIRHIAQRYIDK